MAEDRRRKDEIRAFMQENGVKYNVARRALQGSTRGETDEENPWPSAEDLIGRLVNEPLETWFGQLPPAASPMLRQLNFAFIADVTSAAGDLGWSDVGGGELYLEYMGEAPFEVTIGGGLAARKAVTCFREGTLRPLVPHFDGQGYDLSDPEECVQVVSTSALQAVVHVSVVRDRHFDTVDMVDFHVAWGVK